MDDLAGHELEHLLSRAADAKSEPLPWSRRISGRQVALIFEKPSTRTRVSLESAVTSMGGHAIVLRSDELQLGRGETIEDTGRVLSRYVDLIAIRTFGQDRLERLADAASVPVINALSDDEHPCQCLADLMTIREKRGASRETVVAYVGDGNNVLHSLMLGAARLGLEIRVATPSQYQPFPRIVERAGELAREAGVSITVTDDPKVAAKGAHVLYTDVWTSMGQEGDEPGRTELFAPYRLDEDLVAHAAHDAIVMHCLPAHRGEEIAAGVIDGPRSVVWDQAENRLHAQKAVLDWLLND